MKKVLCVFLLTVFGIVCDGHTYYNAKLKSAFGSLYNGMATCKGSEVSGIGSKLSGKITNPAAGDEYGLLWMIATDTADHGAYFCPMFAVGANKNGYLKWYGGSMAQVWTNYVKAGTNCFWLCKEGYTGGRCMQSVSSANSCSPTKINAAAFNSVSAVNATGEHGVPGFDSSKIAACGTWPREEHNSALVIKEWAPGGHGAFVQPVIFRTSWWGDSNFGSIDTKMLVFDVGSKELVCKNGYKPNGNKTDCVEINAETCALAADNWCSGYSKANYKADMHNLDTEGDCAKYTCQKSGYGFKSTTDHTCVECPIQTSQGGVSPAKGVCVECNKGDVFDEKASSSNYCSAAKQVSKEYLTKGSSGDKTCWHYVDPKEYKDCVLGTQDAPKVNLQSILQAPLKAVVVNNLDGTKTVNDKKVQRTKVITNAD